MTPPTPIDIIPPTICRDCVWATWDGNVQEDCKLGRLDKLEANGATLVPQESGGKRYLSIHNRFCNTCFNEDALKDVPRRKRLAYVMDKAAVQCEMVVVALEGTDIGDLKRSIASILDQVHPAKQVTVATNSQDIADDALVFLKRMDSPITWQVTMATPSDDGTPATYASVVDQTLRNSKRTYYAVCNAGYAFGPFFLDTINQAINQEMDRFVALWPEDEAGNALFVQTALHNALRGNAWESIATKLADLSEELGQSHMIKRFEDLVAGSA